MFCRLPRLMIRVTFKCVPFARSFSAVSWDHRSEAQTLQVAWRNLKQRKILLREEEYKLELYQRGYDEKKLALDMEQRPLKGEKELIFKQDLQGYEKRWFVFKTNAPLTAQQMSMLTWRQPGAGRISASFGSFVEQLEAKGFKSKMIRELDGENVKLVPSSEMVIGATGNH
jgi:hypothetical protein